MDDGTKILQFLYEVGAPNQALGLIFPVLTEICQHLLNLNYLAKASLCYIFSI